MSPSETHFLSLKQRLKILQFPTLPSQSVHQDISSQQQAMKGCQAQLIGAMRYRMVATPAFSQRLFSQGIHRKSLHKAPAIIYKDQDHMHGKA